MSEPPVQLCCPLCRRLWSSGHREPHMEPCPGCGVPTTVPPPDRDVFSDGLFEDGSYGGTRLARRKQWLREAGCRIAWVQQYVQKGSLLEIGSATGEFIALAEAAGFQATGLEASEWAATASKDLTANVLRADPAVWLPEHPGHFDVVALFHTLEHVHEPHEFLEPLIASLPSGGHLFLEVPNGAARDARDGGSWLGAMLSDHVLHYREADLRRLLTAFGLQVVSASTHSVRDFDPPAIWALRRLRWLSRGRLRPSEDLLRIVARRQ